MVTWDCLAKDMKMLVTIYNENKTKRPVWFTRLSELLKNEMTNSDISKLEDKLYDLGIIDKKYEKVNGKWTCCYLIEEEAYSFIKNVSENLSESV